VAVRINSAAADAPTDGAVPAILSIAFCCARLGSEGYPPPLSCRINAPLGESAAAASKFPVCLRSGPNPYTLRRY